MTSIKATMAAIALLGLTACSDSIGGSEADTGITQSRLDPTSIAYFNETIGDTVLFDVDQSTLNDAAITLLNAQAEWLINNPSKSITIEGHADEQGTREYNLALGARRAAAVQSYLVSRGLTDGRLRNDYIW